MTNYETIVYVVVFMALILSALLLFLVLFLVPWIITTWVLFKRAGRPGWAALIPVYNYIVMAKIGRQPLWLALIVGIMPIITTFIPTPASDKWIEGTTLTASDMGQLYFELGIYAIDLVTFVLAIILTWRFVQRYGKTIWFALFYNLLPIVIVSRLKTAVYQKSKNALSV